MNNFGIKNGFVEERQRGDEIVSWNSLWKEEKLDENIERNRRRVIHINHIF